MTPLSPLSACCNSPVIQTMYACGSLIDPFEHSEYECTKCGKPCTLRASEKDTKSKVSNHPQGDANQTQPLSTCCEAIALPLQEWEKSGEGDTHWCSNCWRHLFPSDLQSQSDCNNGHLRVRDGTCIACGATVKPSGGEENCSAIPHSCGEHLRSDVGGSTDNPSSSSSPVRISQEEMEKLIAFIEGNIPHILRQILDTCDLASGSDVNKTRYSAKGFFENDFPKILSYIRSLQQQSEVCGTACAEALELRVKVRQLEQQNERYREALEKTKYQWWLLSGAYEPKEEGYLTENVLGRKGGVQEFAKVELKNVKQALSSPDSPCIEK